MAEQMTIEKLLGLLTDEVWKEYEFKYKQLEGRDINQFTYEELLKDVNNIIEAIHINIRRDIKEIEKMREKHKLLIDELKKNVSKGDPVLDVVDSYDRIINYILRCFVASVQSEKFLKLGGDKADPIIKDFRQAGKERYVMMAAAEQYKELVKKSEALNEEKQKLIAMMQKIASQTPMDIDVKIAPLFKRIAELDEKISNVPNDKRITLKPKEQAVLEEIDAGKSDDEIQKKLNISQNTLTGYKTKLKQKGYM